jgi:pimeloyl-ACP methyl ester carboxylesterase
MREKIWFRNSKGLKLCAYFVYTAEMHEVPAVVFAHGLYSNKDSSRNYAIAERLAKNNIAAFLIDFTGHGESEGAIQDDFLAQQLDDLGSLLDHVENIEVIDMKRIGVNGSSTGGIVALLKSIDDQRIKVLCLRAPPSHGLEHFALKVKVPTLVIQGERDPLLQDNMQLFNSLVCEKKMEIVKGAGHLFEEPEVGERMISITTEWFMHHLRRN